MLSITGDWINYWYPLLDLSEVPYIQNICNFSWARLQRRLRVKVRENVASPLGILIGSFCFLYLLWLANEKSWLGIPIGSLDCLQLQRLASNIFWFGFGIYTPQLKKLCHGSLVLLWNPKNSLQSRKSLKEWFSFIFERCFTACMSLAFNDQHGIRSQLERID